jgi:uncharacterized protein (TIGR02145 family)
MIINKTVKIGQQTWMAENLNVDNYRNGDPIPEVEDPTEWKNLTTGAWCYYGNNPENGKKYGKLYNWDAVNDPRGLAPDGWHIPTEAEFEILEAAVYKDGNALKAIGQGSGGGDGTNTSGFSAQLAGFRNTVGDFYRLETNAYFWSSTLSEEDDGAFGLQLESGGTVNLNGDSATEDGFSVRCVKDY